ncbi:MAG: polyprenyl synthetase family protein [Deltaproteobacteria bacterium]|nr:polyprenyl synthetase family protein [Deltaproteobacteria bacterium]
METDRRFLNKFTQHFQSIDEELKKSFTTGVALIRDIGEHSLLAEGKRLRPLLFVLSSQLCGSGREDIFRLSTMFEYLHTASLLHDDVIDNADTRRRKPSANSVWGNSAAVLTGDYLASLASAIALGSDKIEMLKVLNDTGAEMTEGQVRELVHTNNWNTTRAEYMDIIIAKTAVLMSAACSCGAIISNAGKETVDQMGRFGLSLGTAFQLMDDLLDYTSSEERFGKPVGKDIREGKITLPLIYTLEGIERDELNRLKVLFENNKAVEADYNELIEVVRGSGAIEKVRSDAKGYADRAVGFLDIFPPSSLKEDLLALNEYIVERTF